MSFPVASGAVFPGIKQLMLEDHLSSPCRAEVKVLWGCISITLYVFII
jgi:hypothetical protein